MATQPTASTVQIDPRRAKRAAKLIISGEQRPYHTTPTSCDCPDSLYRPRTTCKHRIAARVAADLQTRTRVQAQAPARATNADIAASIRLMRGDDTGL